MKRFILALPLFAIGGIAWAGGGFNGLTVSSGTYQSISTYGNDDGGNRQAIIVGNRTSSDTAKTDGAGSLSVYVNNPTTASVTQSGAWVASPGTGTYPVAGTVGVSGNVAVTQSGAWSVSPGTGVYPVAGTFFQTTQPVSVATPYTVILTTAGINASTTSVVIIGQPTIANTTFAATQSGAWSVNTGTDTKLVSVVGTVNVSGSSGGGIIQQLQGGTTVSVGWGNVISSIPVQVLGTVQVSGASGGGIIQQLQGGTTVSVGYGNVITSVPVQIMGTPTVIGSGNFTVVQPVDSNLNGSFSIKGTSNTVQGGLSDNGAANTTNRLGTLPATYQTNSMNAAGTAGRDAALVVGSKDGSLRAVPSIDISRASYSGSTNAVAVAATATDVSALCGNAANTVLVYGLRVSCTQTTAGTANLSVLKYSSKFTGAWSTMTAVPQDSNYGVVQSSAVWFTANPTQGTVLGHLDDYKLGCIAPATATPNDIYISPASWRTKPIVLRGAAQCVTVNLNSQTLSGGALTTQWEWMEDSSL